MHISLRQCTVVEDRPVAPDFLPTYLLTGLQSDMLEDLSIFHADLETWLAQIHPHGSLGCMILPPARPFPRRRVHATLEAKFCRTPEYLKFSTNADRGSPGVQEHGESRRLKMGWEGYHFGQVAVNMNHSNVEM